jgi:hypothetical protein
VECPRHEGRHPSAATASHSRCSRAERRRVLDRVVCAETDVVEPLAALCQLHTDRTGFGERLDQLDEGIPCRQVRQANRGLLTLFRADNRKAEHDREVLERNLGRAYEDSDMIEPPDHRVRDASLKRPRPTANDSYCHTGSLEGRGLAHSETIRAQIGSWTIPVGSFMRSRQPVQGVRRRAKSDARNLPLRRPLRLRLSEQRARAGGVSFSSW